MHVFFKELANVEKAPVDKLNQVINVTKGYTSKNICYEEELPLFYKAM